MNLFQTQEYLAIFAKHFCRNEDLVDGIWEKFQEGLILLGMKPVLGGEEVTDFGHTDIINLPKGYQQIRLDYIREDSATFVRFKDKAVKVEVSPYVSLPPTWKEYLAGLERKQRKELKRKIKRLEETDSFYHCKEETVKADFDEFIKLHRQSDPNKQKFMSDDMVKFFWDLKTADIPGWQSSLCFLKHGGRTAAGVFSFISDQEVWLYNSGYNPNEQYYSVGLLLKAHLIKQAIEQGKKRFDFLRGSERYKYDLGAKDLNLYRIQISQ